MGVIIHEGVIGNTHLPVSSGGGRKGVPCRLSVGVNVDEKGIYYTVHACRNFYSGKKVVYSKERKRKPFISA